MTDINARAIVFRASLEAASLSFDRGISTALRHDPAPALAMLAAAIESTNEPTP